MFAHKINEDTELQLIQRQHAADLYKLLDRNRLYLRPWHPWVDLVRSQADLDRMICAWLKQFADNRGFHAVIFHRSCPIGVINHLNIDWINRSTWLSYWIDQNHQGKGIVTAACRAFVWHAFNTLKLNRVTIECASENTRSRRIPERLGFKLEGVARGVEWLHNHYADHAMYGLLKSDIDDDFAGETDFSLTASAGDGSDANGSRNPPVPSNDGFSQFVWTVDGGAC